ncbi:glycosyl-4,4'-diaponeurosporenoate acyltransferase CrtO family protein [Oceanobacillus kimchii]
MVLYSCLFNFPIIILQRYNRGRLQRILILKDIKNVELK